MIDPAEVAATIEKYHMNIRGRKVLACVSGGADSMALLHFLNANAGCLGIEKLLACHFNHGIRGAESDRDEQAVRDYCAELGVQLFCAGGRMREREKPRGMSEEMWARNLRRSFIKECCRETGAVAAMAHSLNDSVAAGILMYAVVRARP